ncbi:MAG: sugar transferase [Bacteroidaceae bacterium]
MTINKNRQRIKYIVSDFIIANISWLLLNIYRFNLIACFQFPDIRSYLLSEREIQIQILVPLLWLGIYYYSGYYNSPVHRSRLQELKSTLLSVEIGTLIVFFVAIMNDLPYKYSIFYKLIAAMFCIQFVLTYSMRAIITQRMMSKVHSRQFGEKTIIIGAGKRAQQLEEELKNYPMGVGCLIEGFVDIQQEPRTIEDERILGTWTDVEQIINEKGIESIIVAPDSRDERKLFDLLNGLYKYNLPIRVIAGKYSILSRAVKMSSVYASPMIQLTGDNMSEGQKNIKKTLDILGALFFLILLSPLFLYLIYRIKREEKGSVFYRQERIGYRGRAFTIIKFRTMNTRAEEDGVPLLSSDDDERITPLGRIMRKYRLDELPQFWNILKGEMSFVGPRPERKYFVDKIIEKAPYYCLIYGVKPGLTSWATVKNGYANTMDKMIERLKYDIIYLESRSLTVDIKILFYTVKTILAGQGI